MALPPSIGPRAIQCDGKKGYRKKERAKLAIRRMRGRERKMVAYRCPHCWLFHIGGEGPRPEEL